MGVCAYVQLFEKPSLNQKELDAQKLETIFTDRPKPAPP